MFSVCVLAVEEENTCRFLLEKLLMRCGFKVTVVREVSEALELLKYSPKDFNIVIFNICNRGVDGFNFIKTINCEMDKPVIMVINNNDKRLAMKGIKSGACDFFVKPLKYAEVSKIWQHVFKKEMDTTENLKTSKVKQIQPRLSTKRKERSVNLENEESYCNDNDEGHSRERTSIKWTDELHTKFVDACKELKIEGKQEHPDKILERMGVPGLTRGNISSHLQKYRTERKRRTLNKGTASYLSTEMSHHSPVPSLLPLQNTFASSYPSAFNRFPSESPLAPTPKVWTTFFGSSSNYVGSERQFPGNVGPSTLNALEAEGRLAVSSSSFMSAHGTRYHTNLDGPGGCAQDCSVWATPQIHALEPVEAIFCNRRSGGARNHSVWAASQISTSDLEVELSLEEWNSTPNPDYDMSAGLD